MSCLQNIKHTASGSLSLAFFSVINYFSSINVTDPTITMYSSLGGLTKLLFMFFHYVTVTLT